jgi:hypothetical protein
VVTPPARPLLLNTEAEFLDVIGTKGVFFLAIHILFYERLPPTPHKSYLKLVSNVNIVYAEASTKLYVYEFGFWTE